MTLRPRRWLAAALLLALAACARHPPTAPGHVAVLERAEAARSDWHAAIPPAQGWTPVRLPDLWTTRWPSHDGVVWYRLHWHQEDAGVPAGLLLDYVCMADAVYVNGSLVHRDPALTEPLSRSWIAPQYFLLDRPLLRAGDNTLLVRVSGAAAYQPGLGSVTVGDADAVYARYASSWRWRHLLPFYSHAVDLVMGGTFLLLWLFRRKESSHGWYALSTLLSSAWGWNYVAPSPWPFSSTDAFQAWNAAFFIGSNVAFAIFLLRYCERRWPRIEAVAWAFVLAAALAAAFAPHFFGPHRDAPLLLAIAVAYAAMPAFILHALRTRRADQRVLALCLLVSLLVSLHDALLFFGIIGGTLYLAAAAAPLTVVGMGCALAWRFAAIMRRAEGFNAELRREIDAATGQLRDVLAREHALALDNLRIGERLRLVRDLHDGFGGSLLDAIAALEQPQPPDATQMAARLKELRDDLRLVIETTTHEQDADLAALLAALRRRWSQRLESVGIDGQWRLQGLEGVRLGATRTLDLLRLLQEALTNALRHSGASRVAVEVVCDGARLRVQVLDDGRGFGAATENPDGIGLASLRSRAAHLDGQLLLEDAADGGARVRLAIPLHGASTTLAGEAARPSA